MLSSRKFVEGVVKSCGSGSILQHVLGNSVKWWLPQDIESIPLLPSVRVIKANKSLKKEKQKECFFKGKKTQIILNRTSRHTRSFMKDCKKIFFGSPTANLQLLEILFFFFVAWWPRSTLRSQVSFRVVWCPCGPPTNGLCEGMVQDSHVSCSSLLQETKRPFLSHPTSISIWLRLADCFSVFSPLSGWGRGTDACGSNGIMALISELPESNVHHQADCENCCTF